MRTSEACIIRPSCFNKSYENNIFRSVYVQVKKSNKNFPRHAYFQEVSTPALSRISTYFLPWSQAFLYWPRYYLINFTEDQNLTAPFSWKFLPSSLAVSFKINNSEYGYFLSKCRRSMNIFDVAIVYILLFKVLNISRSMVWCSIKTGINVCLGLRMLVCFYVDLNIENGNAVKLLRYPYCLIWSLVLFLQIASYWYLYWIEKWGFLTQPLQTINTTHYFNTANAINHYSKQYTSLQSFLNN